MLHHASLLSTYFRIKTLRLTRPGVHPVYRGSSTRLQIPSIYITDHTGTRRASSPEATQTHGRHMKERISLQGERSRSTRSRFRARHEMRTEYATSPSLQQHGSAKRMRIQQGRRFFSKTLILSSPTACGRMRIIEANPYLHFPEFRELQCQDKITQSQALWLRLSWWRSINDQELW